jgi:predicted transcriptional regulator
MPPKKQPQPSKPTISGSQGQSVPIQKPQQSKPTISGSQGQWVPIPENLFANDELWSGRVPCNAWRVYCWLVNRCTKNIKIEGEDTIYGVVAGENLVPCKSIAKGLKTSWSSVRRSVNWLAEKNLITRSRSGKGEEYRYYVVNSIRALELERRDAEWLKLSKEETAGKELEFLDESKAQSFNIEGDDELA